MGVGRSVMLVYVAVGGAIGALARYGVSGWMHGWSGTALPWGTLLVNLSGSLLLGFSFPFFDRLAASPEIRALVAVGFFGAYTTFSTFSYETVRLLQAGNWGRAGGYVLGSVLLGVLGAWFGLTLGSLVLRTGL